MSADNLNEPLEKEQEGPYNASETFDTAGKKGPVCVTLGPRECIDIAANGFFQSVVEVSTVVSVE